MTAPSKTDSHMPPGKQHSKEDLLTELQALGAELEEPPTQAEMDAHGAYSSDVYRRRFGSWNEALAEAGFAVREHKYSTVEIIEAIRELADTVGRPPTAEEMATHGDVSPSTVSRRFGSWNQGLREAGLEPETDTVYSYSDLISQLHSLALNIGRPPTRDEVNRGPGPTPRTYQRVFTSFSDALIAAGFIGEFEQRMPHRSYSRRDLIDYLEVLAETTDPIPTWWDYSFHEGPDRAALLNHFSSFQVALSAADLISVQQPASGGDSPQSSALD